MKEITWLTEMYDNLSSSDFLVCCILFCENVDFLNYKLLIVKISFLFLYCCIEFQNVATFMFIFNEHSRVLPCLEI